MAGELPTSLPSCDGHARPVTPTRKRERIPFNRLDLHWQIILIRICCLLTMGPFHALTQPTVSLIPQPIKLQLD